MTTFYIYGQILTLLSYIIYWIAMFLKKKKNILFLDNISSFIVIIAFIFLGTYDGIKYTLYVILRNSLGQIIYNKEQKYKTITFILMLLLLVFMYSLNFNGVSTICVAICGILSLYGIIMCNEQGIRILEIIGSLFYAMFMLFTSNIAGLICESISFIVILISYIKYKNKYS